MKPTRKISRSSFMTLVSGQIPSAGGQKGGGGKGAVESDHDLLPPGPGGAGPGGDPDSGPH